MGLWKESYTKPLPKHAEVFTRSGQRYARWTDRRGKKQTAKVITGRNGTDRIHLECNTFTAWYRDGRRLPHKVGTGCRTRQAAEGILSDLRQRAELVKAKVLTAEQADAADHATLPIQNHFDAYRDHLAAKGVTERHTKDTMARLERLAVDCGFGRLADLAAEKLDKWLVLRSAEGMGASTRNAYRESLLAFGNWCVQTDRLVYNPAIKVPLADEKADPRRQRRALTEDELQRLLIVAKLRPLADFGRPTVKLVPDKDPPPKRSTWTRQALTFDALADAAERGRKALDKRPDYVAKLERLGRERALIYKALVLTGLRKSELGSLTVGALDLEAEQPYATLKAADEKNRQGSVIPLRADLADDIRQWLTDKLAKVQSAARLKIGEPVPMRLPADTPLFTVPAGLVRILDRDLVAAGIARMELDPETGKTRINKRDERGRSIDVHALRTSFGTHLSKGGVALRTAQAAMRHSTPILTANVYTDPKLLDVAGALAALPALDLNAMPERAAAVANGTDGKAADPTPLEVNRTERTLGYRLVDEKTKPCTRILTNTKHDGNPPGATIIDDASKTLDSIDENARLSNDAKDYPNGAERARTANLLVANQQAPSSNPLENQQLTKSDNNACRHACIRNQKQAHDGAGSDGTGDSFAAALAMIATLPLTDAEKAEAVRRLLATREGNQP